MFESMEDLMAAISGEYGEEAQEQALDFAEESGLLAEWAAHEEAEEPAATTTPSRASSRDWNLRWGGV